MNNQQFGLLSLPPELLENIINYFVDRGQWEKDKTDINWNHRFDKRLQTLESEQRIRRQTICSLRLVNKRLRDAANHVLIPVLRIHLNEGSLERAEEISKITSIAAAVQGVELILAYCPDNLANDLATFTKFKSERLDSMSPQIGWEDEDAEDSEESFTGPERSDESLTGINIALNRDILTSDHLTERTKKEESCVMASWKWKSMRKAWITETTNTTLVQQQSEHESSRKVLYKGFQRFQQLHAEQRNLITTGTFATRLANICARLPAIKSLCFKVITGDLVDQLHDYQRVNTILNANKVIDILAEPLPWLSRVEIAREQDRVAVFAQIDVVAALFWDIPIALSRASTPLQGLHIHTFPADRAFELGTPSNGYLGGTKEEFRKSMSQLRSFHFLPYPDSIFVPLTIPERTAIQEQQIAEYIRLCTISQHLTAVGLSLDLFECRESTLPHRKIQYFDLDNALDSMETSSLKSICIEYASMSEADMYKLCSRLDPLHFNCCTLRQLYLHDGSWIGIADILRLNIGSRVRSGKCQLCLCDLYSEEMYRYYQADDTWGHITRQDLIRLMSPMAQINSEPSYISGERDTNPFAVYRQD